MSIESVITENLDIWTSAIKTKSATGRGKSNKLELYGIKKLRSLILDLAVKGKLVAQNPEEQPAIELLKEVEKEKTDLIKNKKIKKIKAADPIDTYSSDLPTGWAKVRLEKLVYRISNGFSGKQNKDKNGYPLTRIESISESKINYDKLGYSPLVPEEKLEYYKLLKGDILLSHINSDFHVGKTAIYEGEEDLYHGVNLLLLRFGRGTNKEFINIVLNQLRLSGYFLSVAQHAIGQSSINQSIVLNSICDLPPLKEQSRIVTKVNELMTLCDQLESQTESSIEAHKTLVETLLATLTNAKDADELNESWQRISEHFDTLFTTEDSIDQLKQTILQLAVMGKLVNQDPNDEPASALLVRIAEEKEQLIKDKKIKKPKATEAILDEEVEFELPSKWSLVKCQDVCLKITDGEHSTPRRTETGHYLLSARNVTNEGIKLSDVDYVPTSEFERIRKRCDPNIGDILISCSGSVGRVAIVDADNKYSMVRSAAMIRPEPSLSVEYLALLLRSPYLQRQIKKRSKQSAQANLFLGAISSLTFAIPPKNEQIKIAEKVDELLAICNLLKFQLSEAQATQNNLADSISSSLDN